MNEDAEITRGHQARQLLENPLLVEALEAITNRYERSWRDSALSQSVLREEAYRMLSAVEEFKVHLTRFVETGKLATIAKETREEQVKRERRVEASDGSGSGGGQP